MQFFKVLALGAFIWLAQVFPATAQVSLDLRNASLRDFVQIVAQSTGRNFILDDRVQGSVTVVAPNEVSPSAIYEIFLNVLELNRLTIVEGEETDRIVPIDVARELAPGQERGGLGGDYETRVIVVRNSPVADIAEVVRPLLPAEAVLSTVPDAGLMILSDRRENFQRIVKLVDRLDTPSRNSIETIPLRNGNASDMLGVINTLAITPAGSSLSADSRSNALIVSGTPEFRDRVRNIVNQLDKPQRSIATEVVRLNYADASDLADVVRQSFGAQATSAEGGVTGNSAITIVAEPQQNALIITAPSDRVKAIVTAVRGLDQRPDQVLIEAVIFELSVDSFSDLSFQFGGVIQQATVGGVEFALQGRPTLTNLVGTVLAGNNPTGGGTGGTIAAFDKSGIGGFLAALASKSSTKLLSTPSILTLNNREAEIVVAQNVPFVTGSFSTVGDSAVPNQPFQTIQRQDVGLTLKVTPQITRDKTVRLEISQEVSNLTNSASAAGGEITSKRQLSTNVLVRDGHVIMLGGLMEDGNGSVNQRVPGLSELPLLGRLFKGRSTSQNQRILLVMMRPRILSTDAEARELTRRLAREAKRISAAIAPPDDGTYPQVPDSTFPFDGANLNQPFDAGFIDKGAQNRRFPPLPSRLQFVDR
ncbi:general secretion pathway protein D [Roseovarius marisflavi]|uniref:General secretion pathway protein D n=1 Tax=Roseovarius marisflavi TaxID=1054996 RepID=A0A1M6YPU2_9RHOB|nr:type II secretion system secretin GspD [Roseovarius marisflavi]SHL20115.1 general secretion pathway protein D [Roseovarius marisflavi]